MSMFTCMVPNMYVIIHVVDVTDQLLVSCDMLYYTIPVTDGDTASSSSQASSAGDTASSSSQASSATPQDAVKTSSRVVGKCIIGTIQVFIM